MTEVPQRTVATPWGRQPCSERASDQQIPEQPESPAGARAPASQARRAGL